MGKVCLEQSARTFAKVNAQLLSHCRNSGWGVAICLFLNDNRILTYMDMKLEHAFSCINLTSFS